MTVDQIFAEVYSLLEALGILPFIRAGMIIVVTVAVIRSLLNRGG